MPTAYRGLAAQMILCRQYRFLLDCGEGTQQQILRSGLGFKRLDKVLLTHGHLDHILGLGGLVSTLTRWETLEKLEIYGTRTTLERVYDLVFRVALRGARPPVEIALVALEAGAVILEDDKFILSVFPVSHRGSDSLGYLFQEKAHRPFLAEKAAVLGVPFGPERSQLVRGESVMLTDGRTIQPDDVLGEVVPGVKYVHVGDAGRTDDLVAVCQGADTLVIEATYTEVENEMAREFGHLTAARAARLAHQAGVQSLILTHLSRRYHEREIGEEARAIFPNTFVARDFDHFQIVRGGAIRLKKD